MGLPQTTIAFLDESGVPEIPSLARRRGGIDEVFCFGLCFSGIHYWQEMKEVYRDACVAFGVPLELELKWSNLMRKTGPASHMDDQAVHAFVETVTRNLDPERFQGVCVSLWKDSIFTRKGYIHDAQDIYNVGVRFALQRLQNELDELHGQGTNCPTLLIADSRGGQDSRLRRFVKGIIEDGDLWVRFDRSLVEGVLFQVSHYSVGIQLADFLAGAVFQKDARGNSTYFDLWKPLLRRKPGTDKVSGYGYVAWRG